MTPQELWYLFLGKDSTDLASRHALADKLMDEGYEELALGLLWIWKEDLVPNGNLSEGYWWFHSDSCKEAHPFFNHLSTALFKIVKQKEDKDLSEVTACFLSSCDVYLALALSYSEYIQIYHEDPPIGKGFVKYSEYAKNTNYGNYLP
jgi:hypothetical protein